MKTNTTLITAFKRVLFLLVILFTHYYIFAQTCKDNTFTFPGAPSSCTYIYTSSGWNTSPPSNIGSGDSVCILANNSTNFGTFNGTLYVASDITYSGSVSSFNGGTILIEGTASLINSPSVGSGTDFFIETTGILNIPGTLNPGGSSDIQNAGQLNIGGDLVLGGQASITSYSDASLIVQGNVSAANTFNNCGVLEVFGNLSAGGSASLDNDCTVYVHNDLLLSSSYTSENLLIVDGSIVFNGQSLTNNGLILINNIVLDNDNMVGNFDTSILIVRNNAELRSGSSITGHYYYDIDDQGGFDSVCGNCTDDIDVLSQVIVPTVTSQLLENCGEKILIESPEPIASIDFDGIDDYGDSNMDFSGMTKMTTMAWIKLDPAFSNTGVIINQGNFLLDIDASKTLSANINSGLASTDAADALQLNKWYHVAVIFDSSLATDNLKLYVNGKLLKSLTHSSLTGPIGSSTDKFTIGKSSNINSDYFKGAIDEVRVFNKAITENQLHQMIHQEIDNNSGIVKGKVVPKNIVDFNTTATIPWSALEVYYPMTNIISNNRTDDFSNYNGHLNLYNITTVQKQTAPLPYTTKADGDWDQMNTWQNGDVWDISINPITNPWSIIKVSHNMVAKNDVNSHALIIDADKSITVVDENAVTNLWYLELNGTLDLQGDSQLIQGTDSDLVTSADGKILRRQEGNANFFRYNYWSSPVGSLAATSLTDNNGASSNPNNTRFSLSMLKDENGSSFSFTNAYNETGKISTQWLYNFQNGITYYDWVALNQNSVIQPGLGYTQKGINNTEGEQQYIFEGKPNNGTILVAANDVDGDNGFLTESVVNSTLTTTLIGNPYPSALNAKQFILDNRPGSGNGTISGTIRVWEQWAGTSHYLADYEGGYAFINLIATERGYQWNDPNQTTNNSGTLPTFNIPVGQGFFVEVINDGNIEFNNAQRTFAKESDADGTNPNNGSTFFRSSNAESTTNTESTAAESQILRLEFGVSSGASRSFVLGFSEDATDGYDYGLDSGVITNPPADDMGSLLEGSQLVIQTYAPITPDKEIDLVLHASGSYTYTLKSTEITNIPEGQDLFLIDNLTGESFNLRNSGTYDFTSEPGTFTDRFKVVFQDPSTLSNEEFTIDNTLIYVNQMEDKLYVKALTNQAKQLRMTNMLGQVVKSNNSVNNQTLENGIDISNLNSGVYIVSVQTENNQSIDKKVIIN